MFRKKLKWYLIFESLDEFEELFSSHDAAVHHIMFFGEVLLVKNKGEYFAFKNQCPHQKKPLNGCTINNGDIVCPFHRYQFSLDNGRGHGLFIDKYRLKFNSDGVFLGKEIFSLF